MTPDPDGFRSTAGTRASARWLPFSILQCTHTLPHAYNMELELVLIRAHDGQKAGLAISDDDLASCEVISVAKGSPAESCGLRPHDRIIAIDGLECTAVQPATSLWRTGAARLERRLRVRRFFSSYRA